MDRYFTMRRTVRSFTDREVSEALIADIVKQAAHAPTTGNMQVYSVVVTRDAKARQELAKLHFSQPASTGAPVLLTFCADFHRFSRWCEINDADAGYGNDQGFLTAFLDAVIFAQQFNTIAEMNGLGCCYLGTTTYNAPGIAELLHLPRLVVPVVTLAVGWPAAQPDDCGRLPVEAILHHEVYEDYSDKRIAELYAEKEGREDSRNFVCENGKKNLAQVFTDVRYPRGMMEQFSQVWRDFLANQWREK